ncbi:hypothetical protein J1605_016606 [Eschrichtius robustus]|uniref:Uncharacterized protein n=1 Tax=Eschrichtius robustus TaxID=9764 RepID=A0AB34I244_ESCRO|nr:hypothetical protein J1605_016606 [Eschrichtius robustus]
MQQLRVLCLLWVLWVSLEATDPSVPHQLLHHHACDKGATDNHYQYSSRDNYQESHRSRDQFSQYHHSGEISHNHDPTLFLCPNNPHNPRHSDLLCDRYHTKGYPNRCKYPRSPVSDPNNRVYLCYYSFSNY